MEIDERKIKILEAIINDYIVSGELIGSRTIAKKYNLGISSATIRNEMADLEDMGYLQHLHSSSGRRPSDKGYRLYVDKLMTISQLSPQQELMIKQRLVDSALHEVDKMIKQATILMSQLTNLICIVRSPSVGKSYLTSIKLLKIGAFSILLIIITDSGIIKNNIIKLASEVSDGVIEKLNNVLNLRLKGLNVESINLVVINNLKKDLTGYDDIFNVIIPTLYDSLADIDDSDIYMEGTPNMFDYQKYNDIDRAKELLSMLYDKNKVKELLNNNSKISIKIGNENFLEDAKECSVISAAYSFGNQEIGSIGVIGPTRIPYSKVISILDVIVKEINDCLTNGSLDYR